jgi:thymidylate synthase (FAD)
MIKAQYIDHMGDDLRVVNSARVSFGKASDKLSERDIKLINYLAKHEHFTPFESCVLTVKIDCPLYISKQIMRHRTASFNEISRRYTSENIEFYEPSVFRKQHEKSKQCSDGELDAADNAAAQVCVKKIHQDTLQAYNRLLDLGVSREMARGVLPQNLMTSFYMTMNLRNFVHFIKLRKDLHAQEEVQTIAKDIEKILIGKFPTSTKALLEL